MNKQKFTLEFPLTRTSIVVEVNPLSIRSIAIAYLKRQEISLGEICLIRDNRQNDGDGVGAIIAIACSKNGKDREGSFFIEEYDDTLDIKELEESEVHYE